MTAAAQPAGPKPRLTQRGRRIAIAVVAAVVLVLMAVSTKYVGAGATVPGAPQQFDAATYGAKQFPVQQKAIAAAAVEASTLATELGSGDVASVGKKYGTPVNSGASYELPVKLTGVVGEVPAAGYTPVKVDGLPSGTQVNVQLGPAINGTDLRDFGGKSQLGDFENQIQYQDAATAINDQMKKDVLAKAGTASALTGKTVTVTGVFQVVNPKLWNITPSALQVQS